MNTTLIKQQKNSCGEKMVEDKELKEKLKEENEAYPIYMDLLSLQSDIENLLALVKCEDNYFAMGFEIGLKTSLAMLEQVIRRRSN